VMAPDPSFIPLGRRFSEVDLDRPPSTAWSLRSLGPRCHHRSGSGPGGPGPAIAGMGSASGDCHPAHTNSTRSHCAVPQSR
jgi:hypothetical protein